MDITPLLPLLDQVSKLADQAVWFHDFALQAFNFLVGLLLGMGFIYGILR